MPAAITEFVNVSVLVEAPVVQGFGFGSLLGVFEHDVSLQRQMGPYFSLKDMTDAGFTLLAAPEVYYWGQAVFSQANAVDQVIIGRRIPITGSTASKVWQVDITGPTFVDETVDFNDGGAGDWDVFPALEAVGDYAAFGFPEQFVKLTVDSTGGTAGVDGVVQWEYWNGTAWTALDNVVDGTSSFTAALGSGQEVSWDLPTDWMPLTLGGSGGDLFYVRARITTVYTTNPAYSQGTVAGDGGYTQALDAILAFDPTSFYFINIESRVVDDISEAAAWTEAQSSGDYPKFYIGQSNQADWINGNPGNIGQELADLGYKKTALWYHATSSGSADGYLDGAISSVGGGFDLDGVAGVGTWFGKILSGITFDELTSTQAANVFATNGNIYGRNFTVSFTSKGTTAFGAPYFIDVATTLDWTKQRMQEALLSALVSSPTKIPYTNAGMNTIAGFIQQVLDLGVSAGHFSPDEPPTLTFPDVRTVSAAKKQAREADFSATVVLAGAIQKVNLTVYVSF